MRVTSTVTGRQAEAVAAAFLQKQGWRIIDRNWRTSRHEIDLICQYQKAIYFCEVKYRLTIDQGGGAAYITADKLRRMSAAAETWVHTHSWEGEYQLCALELTGPDFQVTLFVTDLTA